MQDFSSDFCTASCWLDAHIPDLTRDVVMEARVNCDFDSNRGFSPEVFELVSLADTSELFQSTAYEWWNLPDRVDTMNCLMSLTCKME